MTPEAPVVAISVSDSPDLARYGLSPVHLRHAFVEIARQLLASGASLAYGGDLRRDGFTDILLDLLHTYQPRDRPAPGRIRSYLAGPVSDGLSTRDRARLKTVATVVTTPTGADWATSLTTLRRRMAAETDARVVVGGQVTGFRGRYPGIFEESLLTLRERRPLYLLGGFGGCTRLLTRAVGGEPVAELAHLPDAAEFAGADLRNGLTPDQNRNMFRSADIDELVALLLRGLRTALPGDAIQ